ncbi:hypothetical protein [Streptomyces sp. NPDC048639]|uniref:hypothetical protein n=1 Tax=Streptomyces sp. NPDC048639 TaxID=3365581 RepID=UPI0037100051
MLVRGVLTKQEDRHFAGFILDVFPRDLRILDQWKVYDGPSNPFNTPGNQSLDGPEFVPLSQNERLYQVEAQLLCHHRLLVRDGSLAITMRHDTPHESDLSQDLHREDGFLLTPEEIELVGCYYFTDVAPGGGGIHVVPGGHCIVEEESRAAHADGNCTTNGGTSHTSRPSSDGRGWRLRADPPLDAARCRAQQTARSTGGPVLPLCEGRPALGFRRPPGRPAIQRTADCGDDPLGAG